MHVLVSCVGTVLGRLKVPASWQAFAGGGTHLTSSGTTRVQVLMPSVWASSQRGPLLTPATISAG